MCSYNKINGYYASMNKYLLNDVLEMNGNMTVLLLPTGVQ